MHLNYQRIVGYLLPLGGYLLSRFLYNPSADDHRPALWCLPIGCFLGAALLLFDSKRLGDQRSDMAIIVGAIALAVGLYYGGMYLIFDGWLYGI